MDDGPGAPDCVDVASIPTGYTGYVDMNGSKLVAVSGGVATNAMLAPTYGNVRVFDVSAPATPTLQGEVTLDSSTGCWATPSVRLAPGGDYAYLYEGACYGLSVVDLRDPKHPAAAPFVGGLTGAPMDLNICGDVAYVAVQLAGVAAFDLTNPGAPVLQKQLDIADAYGYPRRVSCQAKDATTDYVYLGDGGFEQANAGLRVYEYDKIAHTFTARDAYTPSPQAWGGRAVPISSSLLYMTWSNSSELALFDVSNPSHLAAPVIVPNAGTVNTQLLLANNRLFTSSLFGLSVYDVSTPASPVLLFQKPLPDSVAGINRFVTGGHAYLAYTTILADMVSICRLSHL